jgi:hypothetical protein
VGVEIAAHGRIGEAARFGDPTQLDRRDLCPRLASARLPRSPPHVALLFFRAGALEDKPRHLPRITYTTLFPSGCVKLRTVLLCRRYALRSRKCSRADLEQPAWFAYHDLAALLEPPHV